MRAPSPAPTVRRLETIGWIVALLLFAAFMAFEIQATARMLLAGHFILSDFFAQHGFARFALQGHGAHIYDDAALQAFLRGIEPTLRQTFPFPYPPSFLLYIAPLGTIGFLPALAIWMAATLALYLWAAWPREDGWLARGVVLLAPAVAANLIYGQNGLLTAGLLLGGLRLLPTNKPLAGLAFGLLSFKPQFGLLIPVALIAAAEWRCIAATAATLAALIAASVVAFGWAPWPQWLAYLPAHADYLDAAVNSFRKPTVQAALMLAGMDPVLARGPSLLVLAAAIPLVWDAFRRRHPLAPALLVAASFAAAPYTFIYDLPALIGVALAALAARPPGATRLADDAIIALALLVPALLTVFTRFHWVGGAAQLLLFGLITWRARAPA